MNFGRTLREMHKQVRRDPGADTIHLGEDELFSVLADSRRRFVVDRLADGRDAPTCTELASEIAADETHMAVEQVPPRRVQPVEEDLRTEQLPRLDDVGVVRWDGGNAGVRPGHSLEAVGRLLQDVRRRIGGRTGDARGPFTVGGTSVGQGPGQCRTNRGQNYP